MSAVIDGTPVAITPGRAGVAIGTRGIGAGSELGVTAGMNAAGRGADTEPLAILCGAGTPAATGNGGGTVRDRGGGGTAWRAVVRTAGSGRGGVGVTRHVISAVVTAS
ncbi:MAG: hypothetical protein AB7T06_05710 [Kofleriaceae bacterium]